MPDSEHGPPERRLILRLGQGHNKIFTTMMYRGRPQADAALLTAARLELDRRHQGCGWKTFDHVEIVGTEDT